MQKAILSSFLSISIFCIPLHGATGMKKVFRNYKGEQIASLVQKSGSDANDVAYLAQHNRSKKDYFAVVGFDNGKSIRYVDDRASAKKIYTTIKRQQRENTKKKP